jgi:iron complex transport system substrate-binding protein
MRALRLQHFGVVALALLVACSGDERAATAAEPGVRAGASALPSRVLPANVAAAEFVACLLGPERIVALPEQVDDFSAVDFRARGFERLPRFSRYHAEPLIVLAPDLVITHTWQSVETTEVLRRQGIDVLALESAQDYAGIRRTLEVLGERLGAQDAAHAAINALEARTMRLRQMAQGREPWRALCYSNDGSGGYTAGKHTTVDTLLGLVGLRNAAAEAGIEGHLALDFERLIEIDPDVIVVSAPARGEGGSATRNVLLGSAPLATLRAIREQRIAVLPAALISADSPCLVDAAEALAAAIESLRAGTPAPVAPPPRKP